MAHTVGPNLPSWRSLTRPPSTPERFERESSMQVLFGRSDGVRPARIIGNGCVKVVPRVVDVLSHDLHRGRAVVGDDCIGDLLMLNPSVVSHNGIERRR